MAQHGQLRASQGRAMGALGSDRSVRTPAPWESGDVTRGACSLRGACLGKEQHRTETRQEENGGWRGSGGAG